VQQHWSQKESDPLTWRDNYIDQIARGIDGLPPVQSSWKEIFTPSRVFLSWAPGNHVIAASIFRRPVLYLCWGLPSESGAWYSRYLRRLRLKLVLKYASLVAVNDEITRKDVLKLAKTDAQIVPFLVDTDFFKCSEQESRSDFVVVAGDNDRDEALICEIANDGQRVVRVTAAQSVFDYHSNRKTPNLEIRFRVSFEELRSLYQSASAFLLPLKTKNHAAGQTAALEAIACGTPGVISEGRTAMICGQYPTVSTCESNDLRVWLSAIERAKCLHSDSNGLLRSTSLAIAERHHPSVVADTLIKMCRQISSVE
jgi:hypothetical protein